MLAKGRVLGLAAGVTVTVVAWGVLVFIAIDHGRAPLSSTRDWAILGGATVGAVVSMFLAILCASRLRDLLRYDAEQYDDEPAAAEWSPVRTTPAAAAPAPVVEEDEDDWAALGKGLIPAQRAPRKQRVEATASVPDALSGPARPPVLAGSARPGLTPPGLTPPPLTPPALGPVAANGRGRTDDDPSFVSYAGQGEPTEPAHETSSFEPRWANETGEHYYRDLGQRPPSRHSAPAESPASGELPAEDPPPTSTYATPGKRALR